MFFFRIFALNLFLFSPSLRATTPEEMHKRIDALSEDERALFFVVAEELKCPTCSGLSVDQSNATFSMHIKNALLEQIRSGNTKKESLLAFFVDRYGMFILREPPKAGFHLLAWLLPVSFVVLGLLGILLGLNRRKTAPEEASSFQRSKDELVTEFERVVSERRKP